MADFRCGVYEKDSTGFPALRITHHLPTRHRLLIPTSYTPPITTNSSSPFSIPGSNRLKKKIFRGLRGHGQFI
jgi:hypothetical protein